MMIYDIMKMSLSMRACASAASTNSERLRERYQKKNSNADLMYKFIINKFYFVINF